tara:strand:+ start:7900 stop:8793 length:894 start_codon:yes stop_codon:yes gene_type:complete
MALFTGTQKAYYEGADGNFNTGDENYGNYQFISLKDIINNFIISYVGEGKVIPRVKRQDVLFHAQRAIQELSYDVFRSTKSQEIEIPNSLTMPLPHDFVNHVQVSFKDDSGLEHIIYPARKTSNPTAILQDGNYNYMFTNNDLSEASDSDTWLSFKDNSGSNTSSDENIYEYNTDTGKRFGLNPENAQNNGVYYIDYKRGRIHFSSDLINKTITLKYISDSLATDNERIVHKFAEEAMYKWLAHAILSTRENMPEYLVARFKKERFAAIRQAKLRLSNLKIGELTQVMRGKSKQIKH